MTPQTLIDHLLMFEPPEPSAHVVARDMAQVSGALLLRTAETLTEISMAIELSKTDADDPYLPVFLRGRAEELEIGLPMIEARQYAETSGSRVEESFPEQILAPLPKGQMTPAQSRFLTIALRVAGGRLSLARQVYLAAADTLEQKDPAEIAALPALLAGAIDEIQAGSALLAAQMATALDT